MNLLNLARIIVLEPHREGKGRTSQPAAEIHDITLAAKDVLAVPIQIGSLTRGDHAVEAAELRRENHQLRECVLGSMPCALTVEEAERVAYAGRGEGHGSPAEALASSDEDTPLS